MEAQELPLAYFQPSPVRGQLEPQDPTTKQGWRYLQCTDTPNELKVLLPPRTAQVYAYLLSQEKRELAKAAATSWERLLHIRHLKDRMLRKCQRLSRLSTVRQTTDVAFRTIHAPPEFTLKELEKWYRHRHDADNMPSSFRRQPATRPKSPVASRKAAATAKHSHGIRGSPSHGRSHRTAQPSVSRKSSGSNLTYSSDNGNERRDSEEYYDDDKTLPSVPRDETSVHVFPAAGPPHFGRGEFETGPNVTSPDPLPHPYRPRTEAIGEFHDQPAVEFPIPQPALPDPPFPEPVTEVQPQEIYDQHGPHPDRPTLHRKRSSLKRSNSRLSMKSVAWAMDLDQQKSRYEFAIEEIEVAGDDLDLARTAHKEELILLRDLHRGVAEIKERLRLDEETIKLERQKLVGAEEAVRHQEERLRITFEQLEIQEGRYQAKVTTALDEAHRTLVSSARRDEIIYEES